MSTAHRLSTAQLLEETQTFGFAESILPALAEDERFTPDSVFNPLHEEFGFTLDVAATAANARCPAFLTKADNALISSWARHNAWCNHPWSQTPAWVEKAWREVVLGCPLIVVLMPDNRTHQRFWQTLVEPFREKVLHIEDGSVSLTTRFLPGRQHFGTPVDPQAKRRARPKHGCVLLIFRHIEPVLELVSGHREAPQLDLPFLVRT